MYSTPMMMQNGPMSSKCCGFISLRLGCGIICLIWAAFSMYLAVLSFQESSLFYSYMPSAPITVYGVCNLILSLVSVGGIFLIIYDVSRYVKGLSNAIFVCVFLVLVDSFINLIIFITYKDQYDQRCIESASNNFINSLNSTIIGNNTIDNNHDYYNCHNLWQDELKFSIIFYILMFAFYVYWALCVFSHSQVREVSYYNEGDIIHGNHIVPPGMNGPAVPPPAARGLPGGFNNPDGHNVIVLNNAKPKKNSSNRIDSFSFRNFKRSCTPHSKIYKSRSRDSQFTINFRSSPEGNKMDIENAPSPTPTVLNPNELQLKMQQLKRKPVSGEDEYEETYY